ncbi:hypothetical protein M9Y10_042921 [Tritrichomonas musculus]|uniref:Right handed beta helix domain-containing protein n=1 Tax=Tritrichomonas musculus TaxID=1915356 RepID=A0ABR2JY88_9EUKA
MLFYILFTFTKQISINSYEFLRDAVIINNTGTTYDFVMKFDCPIHEGSVKINFVCSACNKIATDRKVWFQANFKDDAFIGLEHENINIHNALNMSAFVLESKASYDPDTYTFSYRVDSGNMRYAGVEESTLKCPVTHDALILDNAGTTYDFDMTFDCPIQEGSVKINFVCSACNKIATDRKVWFQANFKDNTFIGLEHENINIHNALNMSAFVLESKASYDPITYTFHYRVDSGNMRYAGVEESSLKCPGPPRTPTPEPTPITHDALILDNAGTTYDFDMTFDCPIQEGSVKINFVCSACNKIATDRKVWFQANFKDDAFIGLEHENINIHNALNMSAFVLESKASYDPITYTFHYRVDSGNMRYAGVEESSLKCPGPPRTPTATQSPSVSPEIIIIETDNITSDNRISYEEVENLRSLVNMAKAKFTGINSPLDGGAVHIVNMGFQCINSSFEGCSSTSIGGAVYLSNNYDYDNFFTLENLQFKENQAKCGGAAYIYSESKKNQVGIYFCTFLNNVASNEKTDDNLYGGSSLYLTARTVKVLNNNFRSNSGYDVKIVNRFNKQQTKSSFFFLDKFYYNNKNLMISDCTFEVSRNTLCSIFYSSGDGLPYELRSCSFIGKLETNAHFIDGQILSNNSPKLIVKNCKFNANFKRALNLDNNFLSVDLNDQIFNENDIKEVKSSTKLWKIIVAVAVPAVACAAIAVVIITVKKHNQNDKKENKTESEIHDNLIDTALL